MVSYRRCFPKNLIRATASQVWSCSRRMPSASAKLEKQSSTESFDPMKQVLTLVDNKVRNLEKRKGKLDGYKEDSRSGKELNEDQLNAVKKYDQVLEVLEFSRELQKNLKAISVDCLKAQKKQAKREMVERQQEQLHRLKEVLMLQDLLNSMGNEETRQDFLNQTNGAVKLSEEELNSLDELYKLISPERDTTKDHSTFDEQLSVAAEHLMLLLDGRPKEVLGTTYKILKEMLMKINTSGYFDGSSGVVTTEEVSQDEESAVEASQLVENAAPSVTTPLPTMIEESYQSPATEDLPAQPSEDLIASPPQQNIQVEGVYYGANGANNYVTAGIQTQQPPLTDVLHGQAPINFLQDSQVDLESPHMDPAVVVAHPMAPPPPLGYHSVPFGGAPTVPQTGPVNAQAPNYEPIPTQTFTNQNFANISNIVVPPTSPYIPVNATSSVNPLGLVSAVHASVLSQPPPQPQTPQQPQPQPMRTSPDLTVQKQDSFMKVSANEFQPNLNSNDMTTMTTATTHYHSSDENEESCDTFQIQQSSSRQGSYSGRGAGRGGPRGAPRSGTSNGYGGGRQRGSYSNNNSTQSTGGRGGYQGNYYNNHRDFNNSNPRRGGSNPRGTGGRGGVSRGGPHQPGTTRGGRGGSGYRSQSQTQQQQ